MSQIESLRKLTVKLDMDGSITQVSKDFNLYKDSYGFVLLQCYVQKTQNATNAPICTVYRTSVNNRGIQSISSNNYNLVYVGESSIGSTVYRLFECPMPKEFTDEEGELTTVFNYYDSKIIEEEVDGVIEEKRVATTLLTSGHYTITVSAGGWNNTGVVLDITTQEAGQINENKIAIDGLQEQIDNLHEEIIDISGAKPATKISLGMVKVGERLSIDEDGLLSADRQVEIGAAGQTEPSSELSFGGLFLKEI